MATKNNQNLVPQQRISLPMVIQQIQNQKVSYIIQLSVHIDEKKNKGHFGAERIRNFDFMHGSKWIRFLIVLDHRRAKTDDEPQLTDDEDSQGRDVPPTIERDLTEIEQQKKRRRTANYQHTISTTTTTTTNGHHEDDERVSPPLCMSFDFCLLSWF